MVDETIMVGVDELHDEIVELLGLDEEQERKLAACLVSHIGEEISDDDEMKYIYAKDVEEYKRNQSR